MKAVIQAGGLGTRLRPITYEIPKPLLPVKKKPIVNHLIDLFARHGIVEVGILIAKEHDADFARWQKAWADELSNGKVSIFLEEKPRGTFGGLELLKEWVGDKPFFMTNADDPKSFDLQEMLRFHKAQNAHATISLVEVPDPTRYGVPIMNGHKIHTFLEKPENPPSNFINAGLYVLEPEVFSYADFSQNEVSIERDVFPKLAAEGKLAGFKIVNGRWFDCGTLEGWERAMKGW